MATFNCLTHLLLAFLLMNILSAVGDFVDDENKSGDEAASNKPGLFSGIFGDNSQEKIKPATFIVSTSKPISIKPAEATGGEKPNNKDEEEENGAVDSQPGVHTSRFLESEEVEEENKSKTNDEIENEEKTSSDTSNKQPDTSKPQQYQQINYQQHIINQVGLIFSNNPNNIHLILSFAYEGDVEHKLIVYKALKNILKNQKNVDVTGKIAAMQDIETNVLVNPLITPNQRSDAEILKRQFYKMIYDQQTEEIKNAINNRIPMNTPRYVLNSRTILDYSEDFCIKILRRSIKILFNETAERLENLIQGVNYLPFITQSIHGLRAIFDQIDTRNDWNARYKDVILLAKALQTKEISPSFYGASAAAKRCFDYMKQYLPYSVKNLIWARGSVCFKNLDTSKYLYPANMSNSPIISSMNSLFLIKPVPQEGLWNVVEKSDSYHIFNMLYGRYVAAEDNEVNEAGKPKAEKNKNPDSYEIIPHDDAVLIKNVRTKKYLKEVGVYVPVINKVKPVDKEEDNEKYLWVIEDCGFNQVMPYNQGMSYYSMQQLVYY